MVGQKHVFWQALILTVIIFIIGFSLGIYFESSRAGDFNELFIESEINLLDTKTLTDIYSVIDLECEDAIQKNIEFADEIYEESSYLDALEEKSKFTNSLEIAHKRYDVLRVLLWINTIKIKEKCPNFNSVVYFYQLKDPSIEQKAKQNVFSQALFEIKKERADEIILIPIAADVGLKSIDIMNNRYDINKLPSVLVNENQKIETIDELEEIRDFLK